MQQTVLPKIIPRNIIGQLLDHLYRERDIIEYSEWHTNHFKKYPNSRDTFFNRTMRFGIVSFAE